MRYPSFRTLLLVAAILTMGFIPLRNAGVVRSFDRFVVGRSPARVTVTPAMFHRDEGLPVPMILGYYDTSAEAGLRVLESYGSALNGVVPFWYTIHSDGSITGSAQSDVLNYAARHHMWVFALIQNMSGGVVYHTLFTDPVARERAIEGMLALVEQDGYDGVNLDFEGISPEDRGRYTSFVRDLSAVLHENGYYLTLSVPAETADEPGNSWSGAYSYPDLARYADLLMIMAYDQHSMGSAAGPVAGTRWVEEVTHYATRVVSPEKVALGIPAYGYDWGGGTTRAISYAQWEELLRTYKGQDAAETGHLMYYQNGVLHDVYFETRSAMERAVKIAVGSNLRGIVLWRLGIEDPIIWSYVHS